MMWSFFSFPFLMLVFWRSGTHRWFRPLDETAKMKKCRHDWFQSGEHVALTIFAKCIDPARTRVMANTDAVCQGPRGRYCWSLGRCRLETWTGHRDVGRRLRPREILFGLSRGKRTRGSSLFPWTAHPLRLSNQRSPLRSCMRQTALTTWSCTWLG